VVIPVPWPAARFSESRRIHASHAEPVHGTFIRDLENETRELFKVFGIKLPPRPGHGSFDGAVQETIETDSALPHALLPLFDARLVLYQTFRELDNRSRKLAHGGQICRRLMSAQVSGKRLLAPL